MKAAESKEACLALQTLTELQRFLATRLAALFEKKAEEIFDKISWLRDEGVFGGGYRLVAKDQTGFNRASINISQVQYEQDSQRRLNSATALSTIIHFENPYVPSLHLHLSWTEIKDASGSWRLMADLNPSLIDEGDREAFRERLQISTGAFYEEGTRQGEHYFFIPSHGRHRGVMHFYLEGYQTEDFQEGLRFTKNFGEQVIKIYSEIAQKHLIKKLPIDSAQRKTQLEYHTLYFFQVLTLDRGTIAGILVHDQNDLGILASLPSQIHRPLFMSWMDKVGERTKLLMKDLMGMMPEEECILVDDALKKRLAGKIRDFYKKYPEAMEDLARGYSLPQSDIHHEPRNR